MRNICHPGQKPSYRDPDESLVVLYRKLHSQGITEVDEDKLIYLKEIMLKLHGAKSR